MLKFKKMEAQYVDAAVQLAAWEYEQECKRCLALIQGDFEKDLREMLTGTLNTKYAKVALEDGKLIGFLAFFGPWDGFFGKVKGAFSPLGCSAFGGNNREKLASMLFEKISAEMAEDNICSYACSRYAHDEAVGKSFVMNGFGIRCSDAVLRLKERHIIEELDSHFTYTELPIDDKMQVEPLKRKLTAHLVSAPCFFPTDLDVFDKWFQRDEIRVFAAKAGDEIIGYMSYESEGETFISESSKMMNICGAYVKKEYRDTNAAPSLLEYMCRVCEKEGFEYLGVDCETLNPTALRFWGKYFQNYTYSYHRRIDERVVGYSEYMKKKWNI